MADVKFEVKKDLGSIGGKKKLTYTSWNNGEPRFDVRDWFDNGNVGKGITFDKAELKSLYGLLQDMFDRTKVEEEIDNPWDIEEEVKDEPKDEILELLNTYPDEITQAIDKLDKLFKGFNINKSYGNVLFADGERLQYKVIKGKKAFPEYESVLEEFGLKSFITDKGNLFIYTM